MKTFLLLSAASLALAGPAAFARSEGAPAPQSAPADAASLAPLQFGSWGVDLSARDTSVRPGDDFDRYANGTWFRTTEIPGDQGSAGVSYAVYNLTQRQLRALVTGASATGQVGALYQSFRSEEHTSELQSLLRTT